MSRKVRIGKITRAHGMKGEVKILPFLIKNPEIIREIPLFFQRVGQKEFKPLKPQQIRPAPGGGFLIKFEGIDHREKAELLHDVDLFVELSDLPPPEEDEYYVYELLGLKVVLPDGKILGEVAGVMPVGPYDLLEVKGPGGKSVYLPMIEEIIKKIDLKAGVIEATPSPDLLEVQE